MQKFFVVVCFVFWSVGARASAVLYFGDSLSWDAFGRDIFDQVNAAGVSLSAYVGCGFSPYNWLSDSPIADCGYWSREPGQKLYMHSSTARLRVPNLYSLAASESPRLVVMQTGTNMYGVIRKTENVLDNKAAVDIILRTKAAMMGNRDHPRKCLWITPPYTRDSGAHYSQAQQLAMADLAEKLLKPECEVFRSYEPTLQFYQNTKGMSASYAPEHPNRNVYRYWATLVIPKITSMGSAP